MDEDKGFMSCPDDIYAEEMQEKEEDEEKDLVDELFGDEDEEKKKKLKECKPKDEFDELYEQSKGTDEDIYATEDFERFDDGVTD